MRATSDRPRVSAKFMPIPPRVENHSRLTTVGMIITPMMNSRMVRPLEMRAMKVPTKGHQAIHLVFCSITPAANVGAGVEKLMRMSRGCWCFCSNFVSSENSLEIRMAQELFDARAIPRWNARWVYALFNLLFVAGYYPVAHYHTSHKKVHEPASRENAEWYRGCLPQEHHTEESTLEILRWLECQAGADGCVL